MRGADPFGDPLSQTAVALHGLIQRKQFYETKTLHTKARAQGRGGVPRGNAPMIENAIGHLPCDALAFVLFLFGAGGGAAFTYIPLTLRLWKLRQRLERVQAKLLSRGEVAPMK